MRYALAVLVLCVCGSATYAQHKTSNTEQRLKMFYTYYMLFNDQPLPAKTISKDTLRKYCSASFLKKMHADKELDYDPIVQAQDYDKQFVKTLQVASIGKAGEQKYCVSYWYPFANKRDSLIVYMAPEAGFMKIKSVCRDGNCY